MRTGLNPKHNEWYEELCALAAVGELSSSEFDDLQQHLAECGKCRELCAAFRHIAADDLGLVAVLKRPDEASDEGAGEFDEKELLSRFLARMQRERATRLPVRAAAPSGAGKPSLGTPVARILERLRRPALSYGTVALLLCAVAAAGAYRLREVQLSPTLRGLSSQLQEWRSRAETTEAQQESTSRLLQQSRSERESLQRGLAEAQARYVELRAQQKDLEAQLAAVRTQLDEKGRELEAAKGGLGEREKQVAQLETRLQNVIQRTTQQEMIAENLRNRLQSAEQAGNAPEAQGFGDAEAKELFGARDLHIVDVYDVDGSGKTRRTYGRVYYSEKKLLIFYAFDLQDKKRNRAAAGFQAWGYRQPNERQPENLGLFEVDDASSNRWVLKVNNPRVLERIDAVFVTLESPNGSPFPRGRRLLYANLAGPANHP